MSYDYANLSVSKINVHLNRKENHNFIEKLLFDHFLLWYSVAI